MAGVRLLSLALVMAVTLGAALRAQPTRPASGPDREVTVADHARRAINELYISPVANSDWGADRLGEGSIAVGGSRRFRLARDSGCTVDLQVVYDDASREERHGVDICRDRQVVFDGSKAVTPAGVLGGAHPVVIVNDAGRPIQQVMISPADSGDWGDDLLAHASLSSGDRTTLTYHGSCLADLRVVYDNRSAEERHTLDLCALHGVDIRAGWTTADLLAPLPAPGSVPAPRSVPTPSPAPAH